MMQTALCNNKSKFHEGLTGFYVQQFRDIIWESMVYFFSKNSVPFLIFLEHLHALQFFEFLKSVRFSIFFRSAAKRRSI